MIKVSVIIPAYNAEKFIKFCVDSIINQTYKNLEIIIVDDGSTDKTELVIKDIDDNRIKYIKKNNEGVSKARNDGIKYATGEYLIFVDSDDWLEKDAISKIVECIKNSNKDIIRINYYLVNGEKKQKNLKFIKDINLKDVINGDVYCYVWLLCIKRSFLIKNEIIFNSEISMMEDNLFYFDILLKTDVIPTFDYPVYNYYYNENSLSRSTNKFLSNCDDIIKLRNFMYNKIYDKKIYNDNNLTKCILNLLKDSYKNNYKLFCKMFNKLIGDSSFKVMLNNTNLKKLNLTEKILYISVKYKLKIIAIMFLFCRFKFVKIFKGE